MTNIRLTKPQRRWLFGGIGFHNSEATMLPVMSERFRDERVLKSFREISPTLSRVFAGYADWTREAMDHFADYYDATFRHAGTLIYMVPGRMPMMGKDFDVEDYAERTAANLEYLIKVRDCKKLRYFCVTNELSVGNTYAYLSKDLELFKRLHEALYWAFRRHGLDVGLMATDCAGVENFHQIEWAMANMDEITDTYCTHLYMQKYKPGSLDIYPEVLSVLTGMAEQALMKEKRYMLGEYGIMPAVREVPRAPMIDDTSYAAFDPKTEADHAISLCEMALAVVNSGTLAGTSWTMFDYPDPMLREDGDSEEDKVRYEVARFSGHGLSIRYNKHGLIRWCDDEQDFRGRAALYTMGYTAKLFKKGSRVLQSEVVDDALVRCAAVTGADGSISIALVNWADSDKEIALDVEHKIGKPLRVYEYAADDIPYNRFNDLQAPSGTVEQADGSVCVRVKPRSVTFLTTDYTDRVPSTIKGVKLRDGVLSWKPSTDAEHCYYRVYASDRKDFEPSYENQIASTVAEQLRVDDEKRFYKVVSVDTSGNVGHA
ncbi:MAG: hypothetical protein J6R04_05765 [Clostridia bacterium]|nr:hypothetical protein [Clostridia bacterium]